MKWTNGTYVLNCRLNPIKINTLALITNKRLININKIAEILKHISVCELSIELAIVFSGRP